MTKKELSSDLVGVEFEPSTFSWKDKDVMLYALGVGARPDDDLDFVYEGKGPKVLPTYAVIPGMRALGGLVNHVSLPLKNLLHGEQDIEMLRPIPPQATVTIRGKISEVWDKGEAAVIGVESTIEDEDGPMCRARATLFVRGAGGFGGERGPATDEINVAPDREPDHVVSYETRPEQGAIYRLSGDRVPLHIDPDFAKMAGYERTFMHGLCTYGFVGRAILSALCGNDPARFKSMSGRFAKQAFFEDTIITKIWETGPGEAVVQAETQDGKVVLSHAAATFDQA